MPLLTEEDHQIASQTTACPRTALSETSRLWLANTQDLAGLVADVA